MYVKADARIVRARRLLSKPRNREEMENTEDPLADHIHTLYNDTGLELLGYGMVLHVTQLKN